MRSNDLMLGFGYDVFFFTLLQDMLATELDTTIGWYQHAVGSLHLYDKDRSRAQQIVAESSSDYALEMDRMTALGAIPSVLAYERQLREGSIASIPMHFETPRCWTQMLEVLLLLKLRRSRDKAGAAVVTDRLARSPYAALLPRDSGPNR